MNETARVNLHCHSRLSDGEQTPAGLVAYLAGHGVRAAALTDHNTLGGLLEFQEAASRAEIGCIAGVEISAAGRDGREIHLLGYGFDPNHPALVEALRLAHGVKRAMAREPGAPTLEDSCTPPAGPGATGSGFSQGLLPAAAAIDLLHEAGGIAVLAHPLAPDLGFEAGDLEAEVAALQEAGLDGIEAYYGDYPQDTQEMLAALADRRGLLASAGSDFHAASHPVLSRPYVEMPAQRWKRFRDAVLARKPGGVVQEPPGKREAMPPQGGRWWSFAGRVVLPAALAIGLFVFAIYRMLIPYFEEKLLDHKKEMIHELTNVACSILAEYDREVREGNMTLEAAQRTAAERIEFLRYGQAGKDYFWITDMHPRMVMHPYRPDLEGQDLTDFKDPRGARVFVEFVNVVEEQQAGYVEYVWQWMDDPRRMALKQSYVMRFGPWNWIVGTGIYVDDVRAETAAMESRMVNVSIIISVASALLLTYGALQSARIEAGRRKAEEELRASNERYRTLVEASRDGILMVLEGRCTYANKTMSEMLGYDEGEFDLLDLDDLIVLDTLGGAGDGGASQLVEGRNPFTASRVQLRKKGGETVAASLSATPISFSGMDGYILAVREQGKRAGTRERVYMATDREGLIAELQSSLVFLHEPVRHGMTPIVTCGIHDPLSKAAALMTHRQTTAVFVESAGQIVGIITDHDMRARCIARGIAPGEPAYKLMSAPLFTIDAGAAVYEAILRMREENVRHLAVRGEDGGIEGVVEARDLLRFHRYSLAVLSQDAHAAESVEQLAAVRSELPKLIRGLQTGGSQARTITRSITTVSDAIARKAIELAMMQAGPAPVRFAFIALGSAGRGEQTLCSDQDNALVFEDVDRARLADVAAYFERLGALICEGLSDAGFPPCPGGVMASNPKWRQPLAQWKRYFSDWIAAAEPQDLLEVMTFFDFRVIDGEKGMGAVLRRHIEEELAAEPPFLFHAAQYALQYKVPIGFFGNIVAESGKEGPGLDLKQAMLPVVNFARLYALKHGVHQTHSLDRVRDLAELGMMRPSLYEELAEVYDCLMQLRLRHQIAGGGNCIDPKSLTHMEETALKEAFVQIAAWQKKVSYDFLGSA